MRTQSPSPSLQNPCRQAQRAKLGQALAFFANQALAQAFRGWHAAASHRAAMRRKLGACLARLRHQALWEAWAAWSEFVQERWRRREQLEAVLARWRQGALTKAFQVRRQEQPGVVEGALSTMRRCQWLNPVLPSP